MSEHVNGSTTHLRNTNTTTIAATTRRNAAPPITEPTSRGSRFWICCECSSVGEKVRKPSAVDVSLRQCFFLLFPELENYKQCCYCNWIYFFMCLFFNEYTLKPAILFLFYIFYFVYLYFLIISLFFFIFLICNFLFYIYIISIIYFLSLFFSFDKLSINWLWAGFPPRLSSQFLHRYTLF